MEPGRLVRVVLLAPVLCASMLWCARGARAAAFSEFVDPNPANGNQFGAVVVPLSTGNVVVTSPFDDFGGTNAGAVYLFNGATGALISTLRGSTANDNIGNAGVIALSNGNYVVASSLWDNGVFADAGAATWGSGTTGVSGVISSANSLVGSAANNSVSGGGVTALSNGNYVVASGGWDNGGVTNAGAVTWCNGATGATGVVSASNSLVGSTAGDNVGQTVTALPNGNYVVRSSTWDSGAVVDAGAATWGSGTAGVTGVVSATNSLVGSTAGDQVGSYLVVPLSNGNYVVVSWQWDNGAAVNAGVVTWCDGATGRTGVVSAANSLVGSTTQDNVGVNGVTALSNGNYVVASANWDNGGVVDAGAATWCNGATGRAGVVSAANSLVGSTASDGLGTYGVTALSNGNYVVSSTLWNNGAVADVGAVTWGSGTTGVVGAVSAANSLVGSASGDQVGNPGVTALSNGNYVVSSQFWNNGAVSNTGAATWCNGAIGRTGSLSAANSLVGSAISDFVGSGGAVALSNGSYVVVSTGWNNGAAVSAGATTWGNGTSGVTGAVSAANSLVGSATADQVGSSGVIALSNGNYVVASPLWNGGPGIANAGAATWGSGTTGVSGAISSATSLVGSITNDQVGGGGVVALSNGNYVVSSYMWDNGGVVNAGAATWGNGATGVSGVVSAANSLVGSTASDDIGIVTALSNGNYAVMSAVWDNGGLVNAGAVTWGSGTSGVAGPVSAANSLVGTAANTSLQSTIVADVVNSTFFARFLAEGAGVTGGGRVRVGPPDFPPAIVNAVDIPNDQGGWLRLTFSRSGLDILYGSPPLATYGIWRHVPGTFPARTGRTGSGAEPRARPDLPGVEHLRAGLDLREAEGTLFVTGANSRAAETAAAFPPGTWALIATVPAMQLAQYVADIPTLSNAAPNDFVVSAHTTTPWIWHVSAPASGQSVDNLAPATPTGLTAAYSGGQTNLQWAANSENDLGPYHLHRGTSADFIPSIANRIATPTSTSHGDVGPAGRYYKLSAVDVNGNESGFALITPDQTTAVEGGSAVAFALDGVRPNPTHGNGVHVTFALPARGTARLELLDVSGRLVREREVGSLGAGRHTVNLAEGRRVAPGIYWVRLAQGSNQRRTRVVVIE